MASFKCDFNSGEIMEALQDCVNANLQSHSQGIGNEHVGKSHSRVCPVCGNAKVSILRTGQARCPRCGHIEKENLVLNWR